LGCSCVDGHWIREHLTPIACRTDRSILLFEEKMMIDKTPGWRTPSTRWSRRSFLRAAGVASAGFAGAALIGCGDDDDDDEATPTATAPPSTPTATPTATASPVAALRDVNVLGIWGGGELESWEAMIAPWTERTGGRMKFVGTRDVTALLTTRIAAGDPPDVATPAEVGLFRQFARDGELVPLSQLGIEEMVRARYPQGFIDLGTVDGELYGFFMKADTKGTVWYNPKLFAANGWEPLTAISTFADLTALSQQIADSGLAPWSVGVESGGASGWPGTDWIQQILLNQQGGAVYDGVIDGSIPFSDPRVKDAWEKFGEIALTSGWTVQEGATGVNATGFIESTYPPFEDPPGAAMVYLGGFAAGFIAEQFPDAVAGEDYDFFPFPGGGVTGGANIVYAFNAEPTTASFMEYVASGDAQRVWVDRGGFTSVNQDVALDAYPDLVSRKLAEQLTQTELFRFDLDDAIGGATQQAFFAGVTEYLANPEDLDDILAQIEAARVA
jgi:alpha-glucoside transport system substrate-binding protein